MFIESRAIDDKATAGSFRTAHQRYASEADTWFDGTPQSIDGRIARARRLVHLAKESVARRGIQTDRLAAISSLEADVRALTALRHDLLTGGVDREDNSPIAGVRIASDEADEDDDEESQEWGKVWKRGPAGKDLEKRLRKEKTSRNEGDDDEDEDFQDWANTWHDHNQKQPNDYLFDEMGRYHRDRFKASLSPEDRRYVTLEANRFLAANTDTNDVRELATRAMHFAQRVTSSYDVDRSGAVTTAFVQKVADSATHRREASTHLRQIFPTTKTASLDGLPPEAMFL